MFFLKGSTLERYLITSALPYANGHIHLGHLAGAYLPADIYARYLRLKGKPTLYICGSDEHGVAITIAAQKENVSPNEIIDKYHFANYEAFQKFGMSFDIYSRTSLPLHHKTAQEFFKFFLDNNYLVEKEEEQFFDPDANMFLPDRYVEGVCPYCGYNRARGDQCDNCGAYYNQTELISPKSLISGKKPTVKKTNHWYFRFDLFQEFLENYISSHTSDWKENVIRQSLSWLKAGLKERPVTRDLSWGISIEGIEGIDPQKAKGKVIYVWFEAVLGYISATKHLMEELSKKKKANPDDWQIWWQDPKTHYFAFIGKDNIVFHTLLFPAMLYARNDGFVLPENVPANEFLNLEGEKFSKSRNWSIDLVDFINDFQNQDWAIDALRYCLACNLPETRDSDFTWKDFQHRNNSELAAIFGNFVNRIIQFLDKNFNGTIPSLDEKYRELPSLWEELIADLINDKEIEPQRFSPLNQNDLTLAQTIINCFKSTEKCLSQFKIRDALFEIMNIIRAANKYFNDEEPWKTIKADKSTANKTLFVSTQLLYTFSILLAPFLPFTCKKLQEAIGVKANTGEPNYGQEGENLWQKSILFNLPSKTKINKLPILFPNIEDNVIEFQISKLGKSLEEIQKETKEKLISYEEFSKIQLRTAKILEAEKVKKSKKLVRLIVDLGSERRQIVAGIGEHYNPEDLVGKTIVVVANLEPAKLMGVESQGMLLAASTSDNSKLSLVTVLDSDIPAGSVVK